MTEEIISNSGISRAEISEINNLCESIDTIREISSTQISSN